ncbi:MAG: serine/threonine-protein kinase [Aquimonas sp.]|nr:serine/threonine-protein kinase [Aquimonas sp.]
MAAKDPAVWARVSALFGDLLELDPAEREARLEALDASEPELARELRALLRADEAAAGPLDATLGRVAPELADASRGAPWETAAGSAFGPYRLIEPIGEGGMGEVWRAERADGAYQQQVAIKLLKRGMDTRAILRRFLQERSILARLDHPDIVHIFDGGMSPDGRPWYAMACVEGEPITGFAARTQLDLRGRVRLLARIAEAVAYAHGQLVVHRDLKPGNILVDAQGQPHLLDFGIAKLLEQTEGETVTATGVRVLSPGYAAPEQILGRPVGTTTDVYALGVIGYQLLTGRLPHRRNTSDVSALAAGIEAEDTREAASRALAQAEPAELATAYGAAVDRRRLARELRGDLDLILSTALRSEPARRYQSAAALAADLHAWLDSRPVSARRDSVGYRMRRFVQRHAWGVAASAVVLLSLLGGLAAALWQAEVARAQAVRAELVKDFLVSLFEESDPVARARVQARSPRELVADGIGRAEAQLAQDPALRREVLADLGKLALALGDVPQALQTLQALSAEYAASEARPSMRSAEVAALLAAAEMQRGGIDVAEPLLQAALPVLRAGLGPEHPTTLQAEVHFARTRLLRGDAAEALAVSERVHAATAERLGAEHPDSLSALYLVGSALEQSARLDEADAVFVRVVDGLEAALGPGHARLVRPLSVRADLLRRGGYPERARPLYERAIAIARDQVGAGHPLLGAQLLRMGDALRRMGDADAAAQAFDEAEQCFPDGSAERGQIWFNRGQLARATDQPEQAITAFETAHAVFLTALGERAGLTWASLAAAAEVRAEIGQLDAAEPALLQVAERMLDIFGEGSYDHAYSSEMLAKLRMLQGRPAEALPLLELTIGIMAGIYGAENPQILALRFQRARALAGIGQSAEALAELDALAVAYGPEGPLAGDADTFAAERERVASALAAATIGI